MNLDRDGIVEVLKTVARAVYFGVLGVVALVLASVAADPEIAQSYVTVSGVNIPVGFLIVAGVGGLAKLVDRYRHEDSTASNGIAPKFLQK